MTNPITDRAGGIGLEEQEQGGIPGQERAAEAGQGNPTLADKYAAQRAVGKCQSCFAADEVEAVQVRHGARYDPDSFWGDSSLRRCANRECCAIREGTLKDRLAHIRDVYGYKYFGDYPLSEEQQVAVWMAYEIAMSVADGASSRPTPDASQVPGTHPDTEGQNT